MALASLTFAPGPWLWPALLGLSVAGALAWKGYQASGLDPRTRFLGLGLKLAGLFLLALCLLEPRWTGPWARPGANHFVVLADNSRGMTIRDAGADRTRSEELQALLAETEWKESLAAFFKVHGYQFDARLTPAGNWDQLDFQGRASSIGMALKTVARRFDGQPLAGILLLTDGNATDLPEGFQPDGALPPIYPVVLGRNRPAKDLSLGQVSITQTAFEDAPITLQVGVEAAGYAGTNVLARVKDLAGNVVAEQTRPIPSEGQRVDFRFTLRPEGRGVKFYRLETAAQEEAGWLEGTMPSPEATAENNRRLLVVDRAGGPYEVLYVSGRPNWEFKMLNRAVTGADDWVRLVGLIRLAKKEPRFVFKGRTGETQNPLFRGFDKTDEETENYDQPVLVRLNTRDAEELRGGFPKTAEDLFAYDAIILDDLEAAFFTRDQMALLQRFVSERGGGFLMLAGQESLNRGGYDRTPIGDLLPVYLDRLPGGGEAPAGVRWDLTREGWIEPWLRLRETELDERKRVNGMPDFLVVNQVRDLKPGASLLASVVDAQGQRWPGLAVQRFGRGRSAVLTVGDLWRWGLRRESEAPDDLGQAWRQLTRWLVVDTPERVELSVETKAGDPNQAVRLQVRARNPAFQPLDNASVRLSVTRLQMNAAGDTDLDKPLEITAEPALEEAGLYQATFIPREAGAYRVEALVTDGNGVEAGRDETGWAADFDAEEFRSLEPNRALLESIARETQGEVVEAVNLAGFASGLARKPVPVTEMRSYPLWHTPFIFLAGLGLLICEWGLRRFRGLA